MKKSNKKTSVVKVEGNTPTMFISIEKKCKIGNEKKVVEKLKDIIDNAK